MIPILYSELEENFTSLGLGALADATKCKVKTVLNGTFELEMQYPVTGVRYKDLQLARIIKAVSEKGGTPQLFDIYKITKPMKGIVTVYASHVSDRKRFIPILPFSADDIQEAFRSLTLFSAEYNPFTFWTDKDTVANFKLSSPASLGQVLGGMQGSVLDTYTGEYEFDNFTVKFTNRRGADNGVTLRYGKNITQIEQEESIASTITGIVPYWMDMDGRCVILPGGVVDSEYAQNYPFKRTVPVDFTSDFETEPTQEQLLSRAESYINSNRIGVPSVGIDVSFEHLADYTEYASLASLEQVKLGDTVHVYFEPLGIETTARITQTDYDVLNDRYNKARVGSAKMTLSYTISGIKDMAVDEAHTVTGMIYQQIADLPGQIFAGVDQAIADAIAEGGEIQQAILEATEGLASQADVTSELDDLKLDLIDADAIQEMIDQTLGYFTTDLHHYITWNAENGLSIKAIDENGQQSPTYLNLMSNILSFKYGDTAPAWMTADTFNINNLIAHNSVSLVGLIMQKVMVGNVVHLRLS